MIRGDPTLRVVGKCEKPATIPLPRRVDEILAAAVGARTHGPILVRPGRDGSPDRPSTRGPPRSIG